MSLQLYKVWGTSFIRFFSWVDFFWPYYQYLKISVTITSHGSFHPDVDSPTCETSTLYISDNGQGGCNYGTSKCLKPPEVLATNKLTWQQYWKAAALNTWSIFIILSLNIKVQCSLPEGPLQPVFPSKLTPLPFNNIPQRRTLFLWTRQVLLFGWSTVTTFNSL